ncbi:hypothetical protein [Paenibacillus uliginis]|nr:hypothetical protein [Paenibacillus uliginis]
MRIDPQAALFDFWGDERVQITACGAALGAADLLPEYLNAADWRSAIL